MSSGKTKKLCIIAMLMALTVVLSYLSGYMRIGTFMKFSVSFVSVYIAAALYGPLAGGFVGAGADIISCFVFPMGTLVWEITLIEGFYGIFYGLIFYRGRFFIKNIFQRVFIYSVVRFPVDLFIKTAVLSNYGYAPENYGAALTTRMAGCLVMSIAMAVILWVMEKFYTDKLIKMANM